MRGRLIHWLQHHSPSVSIKRLIRWSGQDLIFPFYHAIQGSKKLPHIQQLYTPRNEQQFRADLDCLLQHFTPIGLTDLLDHLQNGKKLPRPAFHLSFDDGLREVYDFAFPILKEKGIPATVFLNSAFVDNRDLFFRYKASLLIETLTTSPLPQNLLEQIGELLQIKPTFSNVTLRQKILNITYSEKEILDEIAQICSYRFDDFLQSQKPYLDHRQISALIKAGFSIGAHSVDHPLYAQLPLTQQIKQTQESINWIVEQFELPYKCFAFPF
ncbi:MAG: polysaccharide deacetylase family protein, partial [Bacteroidota bacterium]